MTFLSKDRVDFEPRRRRALERSRRSIRRDPERCRPLLSRDTGARAYHDEHQGVVDLAQEVDVRPFGDTGVDDDEIAKRAIRSLEWDVMVPKDCIQVRVESGLVTLTGEVDWQFERDAAERAVRNLYGVIGFNDQIQLKSRAQVKDIHLRIEDALDRQASVDAHRVQVSVEGGKVHLNGNYKTWPERRTIERAAWSAPGVSSVEDHMTLAA